MSNEIAEQRVDRNCQFFFTENARLSFVRQVNRGFRMFSLFKIGAGINNLVHKYDSL